MSEKIITKNYYDKIAPEWVNIKNDLEYLRVEFEDFRKLLPNGKVIDLGCGTGRDASLFIPSGYDYIGVDISNGMLTEARKLFPDALFEQMDLMKLDFPDECFDGIWSFAAYLHIPKRDIDQAVKEANRVLKPGGIGFISIKKGSKEGYLEFQGGKRFMAFYGKNQFAKILKNNGFEIIKSWEDKRQYNPPEDVSVYLCYFVRKINKEEI